MATKSSVSAKKAQEGDQLMREADKMTAKTLFKWKPDWEGACTVYEKAGTCYKNAKEHSSAKEAYKKAATAFYNISIPFSAAKNMELAGDMAKTAGEDEEAVSLFSKSSAYYRENNTPEKAAEVLVKAAKILEDKDIDKAIEFANDACTIFEVDDKEMFASSTYAYAAGLFIKSKKWDTVLEHLTRQKKAHEKLNQTHDVNKMILSLIIVHLARDDLVAADRVYKEELSNVATFLGSTEAGAAAELLDAFDKRNNEQLKAVTNKQVFNFLSQPMARLAKNLKVTGEGTALTGPVGKEPIEEEGLA